ncbi:MAG: zinc-dependent metalloprotease family protein [Flavobacterium sp.]|nr:zinc-dependent metalloprotease family protein [Flavobacterium sp.]
MKKTLLLFTFFIFATTSAQRNDLWSKINESDLDGISKTKRTDIPKSYKLFNLDLEAFKAQLIDIPIRGNYQTKSAHIIYLPDADGAISRYDVIETPIMEPELQAKFPSMKSYAAQGIDDPTAIARFSITQFGLHNMTMYGTKSSSFIDPYTIDGKNYIVYDKESLGASDNEFSCLTDANKNLEENTNRPGVFSLLDTNDKKLRTYRLALSCNGEYGTIFKGTGTVAQQKANVMAQMVITMTRVNGIYEKELAVTMIFVGNNDLIIYLDATTDPWSGEFNTKTAQTIDTVIGVNNYDIGHNFNTSGGGNAGCLACVCAATSQNNFHKGRGYTGSPNPTGDAFDIDYVAHEMGHQFGGYHTQSNDTCRSGNGTSEVETGSGSSIMGYAGICAANVQSNSDAYFAYVNIRDISLNVQSGTSSSCAQITNFPNNPPTVNAGADYTIPKSTPFLLTATGSDPDGNAITYCWEQRDPEAILPTSENNAAPSATRTAGPMFRTLTSTTSPTRYFPAISTVLTGATATTWEVLPSVARTFNFSVTARDNVAGGGQTASDLMVVNVNGTAGPFLVSTPNTNVSWTAASNQTVTWDVAGTTANGVNCAFVDIYMSSNGGTSFPVLLASKVPNDGTETVTIPTSIGNTNRIMVRGNGNIFYDVSNSNFTTIAAGSTFSLAFSGVADGQNKSFCQGSDANFSMNYNAIGGFSGTTTFSVTGNPAGSTVSFSPISTNSSGTIALLIGNTQNCTPGFYTMTVTGTSGATSRTVKLYLEILNSGFSPVVLISPTNEAYAQPTNTTLNWSADAVASSYNVEIATDIDFSNIIQSANTTTNSYNASGLSQNTNYFWRVLPKNYACQGTQSGAYRFTTGQVNCNTTASTNIPLAISASGTPTINSTITIPSADTISDVNISVQITHTWVADLTLTLISPAGTQIQLVSGKCSSNDNMSSTFDDSGITLVCGTNPAITGTIKPAQLLSTLNGQSAQGVWTLRIADGATGDGGSLTGWSLNICSLSSTPISCGTITSTWNGSVWDNGRPVNNIAAVINGAYTSTGNLEACSLNVTGTSATTFLPSHDLIIDGAVTVAATANLTIENNANLIQIKDVPNSGKITVKRNAIMRRLDYVYWGSPVAGQDLKLFSPQTVSPPIGASRFYTLNETNNSFAVIPEPSGVSFLKAKGYMLRAPNDFPTNATLATFYGVFNGIPNNGNATIAITNTAVTGKGYNMLGNPYPSTISADLFLAQNPGELYFWTHTNQDAPSGANYATYTTFGTTSPAGGATPDGTIAIGQGFLLKTPVSGVATFTNAMRTGSNSAIFFRNANIEKDRIWLNLSNSVGLQNQILIGYMDGATSGIDVSVDAKQIESNINHIASLIGDQKFNIQARALPFDVTDAIPLSFNAIASDEFVISIDHVDGIFLEEQDIFLYDAATGIVHDLKNSVYAFPATEGAYDNRFSIVYQNTTLGIENPELVNSVVVFKKDNTIHINAQENISDVRLFDVRGRLIYENKNINLPVLAINNLNIQQQVLIVQVTAGGKTVSKKIVY